MEKRVFCQINGNRKVIGVLRGYDVSICCLFIPLTVSSLMRAPLMHADHALSLVACGAYIQSRLACGA
jgi:hypothetical protein